MKKIVFVCLGNICRSPLAEGIAKQIVKKKKYDFVIESRGTGSWHIGEPPCEGSIKVAKLHGIDISSHRAKQITKQDKNRFDLVVGLDHKNVADLKALGFDAVLLGNFGFDGADVADPYFFDGFEGFHKVYEMIEICVRNLLDEYSK